MAVYVDDFSGRDGVGSNCDFVDISSCRHHAKTEYAFYVTGVRDFNHTGGFMPSTKNTFLAEGEYEQAAIDTDSN